MPSSARVRTITLAAIGVVLAIVVVIGTRRVAWLEAHERDLAGEVVQLDRDGALSGSATRNLLSAELTEDDEVTFELCSGDAMEPTLWASGARIEIMLRGASGDERILDTTIDAELLEDARRSSHGACLVFGRGTLTTEGTYDVRLAWDAPPGFAAVPLRARILVRRSLAASDGNLVFLVFSLSILFVLAAAVRPAAPTAESPSSAPYRASAAPEPPATPQAEPLLRALGRVALGVGLVLVAMRAVPHVVPAGRTGGLLAGLLLAVLEIVLALAIARPPRAELVGWHDTDVFSAAIRRATARFPRRWLPIVLGVLRSTFVLLVVAPFAGLALRFAALESLASVPSTGEAPIEAYVSLPSGMLSFAIIAVVAPIAEEVFFRGFVYGTLFDASSKLRVGLAFSCAWLIFGVVHLEQTWGNWGGLLAIVVAGLVLTALRTGFRSTLVPALAHLVYNGLLAAMALASAISAGE